MPSAPRKKPSVKTVAVKATRGGAQEPGRKSGVRKDVLSSEVLDRAVGLFAQRGFAGTSLKDVADAVGLSRSAIYYYFPSKDALLEELLTGVTVSAARILDNVEKRSDLTPIEKIGVAAHDLVMWVTERRLHFIAIDRSENELPPPILARHREAKRRVLGGMMRLIDEAVAGGEARAVDSRVTAFAIIGMCNWTAWWFVPDGELTAATVADRIADLAMHSVRRARPADAASNDIRSLTAEIRGILGLIDRGAP
ncbi:TetR family transcriptional regulator [Pseudorhodoplanes sinuspersici]|nr:TetR family transcriptional regulator [Pseudorhodoplanes sinuspersici]